MYLNTLADTYTTQGCRVKHTQHTDGVRHASMQNTKCIRKLFLRNKKTKMQHKNKVLITEARGEAVHRQFHHLRDTSWCWETRTRKTWCSRMRETFHKPFTGTRNTRNCPSQVNFTVLDVFGDELKIEYVRIVRTCCTCSRSLNRAISPHQNLPAGENRNLRTTSFRACASQNSRSWRHRQTPRQETSTFHDDEPATKW